MMSKTKKTQAIESYKFHHIDTQRCAHCREFNCVDACFRGVYEVINKDSVPRCIVIPEREDFCVKCHLCTTVCKFKAIKID